MARAKKTQQFDQVAAKVLGRADKQGKRHAASAVNAWSRVVGEDIGAHTRGFALRENRELTVFVDSAAWANQLSLMATELIERLNADLGEKSVTALRFTVSRSVKEGTLTAAQEEDTADFYKTDAHEPAQLGTIELAQANQVASVIKDDTLREAALKAMIKDLELKKGLRQNASTRASKPRSDRHEREGL